VKLEVATILFCWAEKKLRRSSLARAVLCRTVAKTSGIFDTPSFLWRRMPKPPVQQVTVDKYHLSSFSPLDLQVTMAEQLIQRGTLEGHSGWVTSLATSLEK
jgi:hypothetical protein